MQNNNQNLPTGINIVAVKRRRFIKQASAVAALAGIPAPFQALAGSSHPENIDTTGFAANSTDGILSHWSFERKIVGDNDVQIEILYCGVCHSEIHTVRSECRPEKYPLVSGHEIAGRIVKVGKDVTKFNIGDHAGVGCMFDSCGVCISCLAGYEQYCDKNETVFTYASPDKKLGA